MKICPIHEFYLFLTEMLINFNAIPWKFTIFAGIGIPSDPLLKQQCKMCCVRTWLKSCRNRLCFEIRHLHSYVIILWFYEGYMAIVRYITDSEGQVFQFLYDLQCIDLILRSTGS